MTQLLAIALGGAAGAVSRFWVSTAVYSSLGRNFPYGTLAVNVAGSFIMGFVYVFLVERMTSSSEVRAVIMIGFLGSFTTFSTFSLETLNLLEQAEVFKALLNVVVSLIVCMMAVWGAVWLARQL